MKCAECPICKIKMDGMPMPCGIGPRVYVNTTGYIEAVIPGCPNEQPNEPHFLPLYVLYTMGGEGDKISKKMAKGFRAIAEGLTNAHYQDLWASRDGENYHLDFDAERALGRWIGAVPNSLSDVQSGSDLGGEVSYRKAVSRPGDGRGSKFVVSDDTLRVLQTARTRRKSSL